MRLVLLAMALVCAPAVIGQEPTVRQVQEAYANAGWLKIEPGQAAAAGGEALICISQRGSDYADALVHWLAVRAGRAHSL